MGMLLALLLLTVVVKETAEKVEVEDLVVKCGIIPR